MFRKLTPVALVLIFSGVTVAAEQSTYTEIDTNRDGAIDKIEASVFPVLSQKWKELDANADGMLDQAEFAKFETILK